ncbi:hypothetical protein ACFV3D_10510, partial [Streptomyces sp. NPDC059708]
MAAPPPRLTARAADADARTDPGADLRAAGVIGGAAGRPRDYRAAFDAAHLPMALVGRGGDVIAANRARGAPPGGGAPPQKPAGGPPPGGGPRPPRPRA